MTTLTLIKFPAAKSRRRRARRLDPDLQLIDDLRREHPLAFEVVMQLAEDCLAEERENAPPRAARSRRDHGDAS